MAEWGKFNIEYPNAAHIEGRDGISKKILKATFNQFLLDRHGIFVPQVKQNNMEFVISMYLKYSSSI